ncbi:Elongator subunit elp2 [Xanthoria parietina]
MVGFRTEYIAAGGNRHPAAADWDAVTGLLAYGSDINVALWKPLDAGHEGVFALLCAHADIVNVVKFFYPATDWPPLLLSGSADQTVRLWQVDPSAQHLYSPVGVLQGHAASINCLDVVPGRQVLASGAADATIKIWHLDFKGHQWNTSLLQTIQTSPKFLPLTLCISVAKGDDLLLAAAGTQGSIHVYASKSSRDLTHQATLTGHEGWIRSLAITTEDAQPDSDLLLASASQDKYIRLWRCRQFHGSVSAEDQQLNGNIDFDSLLSNKTHRVQTRSGSYVLTFEALLLGHDDWIYTVSWQRIAGQLRLLSASADSSVSMWDSEAASGLWVCSTRLGEINAQKGSTTATGSMGGFCIGLWSPNGQSVACLGRTGSWRLWTYETDRGRWLQGVGVSGHTKPVMDIAWARDGSYLLSTGSDQTTRLHAKWISEGAASWHEFARPQIHGYDLNCIDAIGELRFVSGADEKLLRVFDEPKSTAELLSQFCGVESASRRALPEAANIPVLGLSNKALEASAEPLSGPRDQSDTDNTWQSARPGDRKTRKSDYPPTEDDLARYTLWPEREKLYGHGHEVSAVAVSHNGLLIATACKASSLDHAVIRIFETIDWRELKPALVAHSLTVTSLRFSDDDCYLLSTGRDRQWSIFEKDKADSHVFALKAKYPRAHSRMILSGCWAPVEAGDIFVTGGRDKTYRIWNLQKAGSELVHTIDLPGPVTAVDILRRLVQATLVLAVATETGEVSIHLLEKETLKIKSCHRLEDQ